MSNLIPYQRWHKDIQYLLKLSEIPDFPVPIDKLCLLLKLLHVNICRPYNSREEPNECPIELDKATIDNSNVLLQVGEEVEHCHRAHDHSDCWENVGMVQTRHQGKHVDQTCWLQTLRP